MPEPLQSHTLFRSPSVLIADVRCRPMQAMRGAEEWAGAPSIAFIRSGVFVKHVGEREVLADPSHIVFFNPDEHYHVSHPAGGGDDCTAFTFPHDLVRRALADAGGESWGGKGGVFPVLHALDDPRAAFVHQGLRRLAGDSGADPLELEELSLGLLRMVLVALHRSGACPDGPRRPHTLRTHRRLADDTRMFLASRFAEPVTLSEIGREVACSPYHLARLFRREVGLPLHRYLNRLRLRAALERLTDGGARLIDIALDLGFSSHGHFTDAFRREFGLPPSAFRRKPAPATLRQMSKNLEA